MQCGSGRGRPSYNIINAINRSGLMEARPRADRSLQSGIPVAARAPLPQNRRRFSSFQNTTLFQIGAVVS